MIDLCDCLIFSRLSLRLSKIGLSFHAFFSFSNLLDFEKSHSSQFFFIFSVLVIIILSFLLNFHLIS